mmetsp:Transcript_12502/g.21697  ORF Transcript_12502/g.21697 Transcript_12502/m.21697 type:complete len:80 (-) Transcript_12502:775-1014(-)
MPPSPAWGAIKFGKMFMLDPEDTLDGELHGEKFAVSDTAEHLPNRAASTACDILAMSSEYRPRLCRFVETAGDCAEAAS